MAGGGLGYEWTEFGGAMNLADPGKGDHGQRSYNHGQGGQNTRSSEEHSITKINDKGGGGEAGETCLATKNSAEPRGEFFRICKGSA